MMAMVGKAYAWRLSQGWRNAYTPAALGFHAGAKNTGSLAVSEVAPATGEEDPGLPPGVASIHTLSPGWAD